MMSNNINNGSCLMGDKEVEEFNVVAILRLITSSLSILGALSIIGSAVYRKTVCNPKVHPIFVLSIADMMLSIMWISGAALWLNNGSYHHHIIFGCFTINLTTVILQCVAMNLTLLYALLAYSSIKQRDFSGVYMIQQGPVSVHVWPPLYSFFAYFIAWTLPVVLIMIPFGAIVARYNILQQSKEGSCWCLLSYGNVLPRPHFGVIGLNKVQKEYLEDLHHFITCYAVILIVNFTAVLVCMMVIYYKVFRRIRRMRLTQERNENTPLFGATQAMILEGQKDAKKRVCLFLLIFFLTGAVTLAIGLFNINFDLENKHQGKRKHVTRQLYIFMIFEALFVPIQGALNAVAYGWTRGDFLSVMSSQHFWNRSRGESLVGSYDSVDNEGESMAEDEERHRSILFSGSLRLGARPIPGGGGELREGRQRCGTAMTPGSPDLELFRGEEENNN